MIISVWPTARIAMHISMFFRKKVIHEILKLYAWGWSYGPGGHAHAAFKEIPSGSSWKLNALISLCAVEIRCSYLKFVFYQAKCPARRKWKSNAIDWRQNSPWKSGNQSYFSAANFVANQSDWFYFSIYFAQDIRLAENAILFAL